MKLNSYTKTGLQFVEVTNDSNLKVTLCNLGASIFSVRLNNYQLTRNLKYIKDFKEPYQYYGKTIGRVSNRMKGNKFILNKETYCIEPNEGKNVLHGGKHGLSCKLFDVRTDVIGDKTDVIFTTRVKHLEDGYPGNLEVEIRYSIYQYKDELNINFSAKSDMDSVLSLTNHAYFTLGSKSLEGLSLFINSSECLKVDEDNLLPICREKVTPVLDFSVPKRITRDINDLSLISSRLNGYDHYFYFKDNNIDIKNASLFNSKIQMDIYTDFGGLQIYTSGFDPKAELYPECDKIHDSVAIEPSDSFEKLHFLKKDCLYSRTIKYIFLYRD